MTSTELVQQVGHELDVEWSAERVREMIAVAAPVQLAVMILGLQAIAEANRVRKSMEIALEAQEAQVRAERRLGQLIIQDESVLVSLELGRDALRRYSAVAALPDPLFEDALDYLIKRKSVVTSGRVTYRAGVLSLKKTEQPDIAKDWRGHYWLTKWGTTRVGPSLTVALGKLQRATGMKSAWISDDPATAEQLDKQHARARRTAQALGILKARFTGEQRRLIEEAELRQAQVAELLYKAWIDAPSDD